eukprot:scaffold61924_cov61-Phaeocystis_antarctica.AAC.2
MLCLPCMPCCTLGQTLLNTSTSSHIFRLGPRDRGAQRPTCTDAHPGIPHGAEMLLGPLRSLLQRALLGEHAEGDRGCVLLLAHRPSDLRLDRDGQRGLRGGVVCQLERPGEQVLLHPGGRAGDQVAAPRLAHLVRAARVFGPVVVTEALL